MMTRMGEMNRRQFGAALAMLGAAGAQAQTKTPEPTAGGGSFGPARVLVPAMVKGANGAERWAAPTGTLATGEWVSMHESVVPAGTPKGTIHVIHHSEFIVVIEGTLSFQHEDTVEHATAGSVLYVAYGTNHLVWNSGDTTARYLVLQLGGDTKKE